MLALASAGPAQAGAGVWTNDGPWGGYVRVAAVAIDPLTPSTLYHASVQVMKSTDSGTSWAPASAGMAASAWSLAIDPATPSNLYAGTAGRIYRSTDGAASWAETLASSGLDARALAVDAHSPATVYAGVSSGVLKSTDAGGTWAVAGSGLPPVWALALDPGTPATLYAGTDGGGGVFKSTDGGATWSNTGLTALATVRGLLVDPSNHDTVYAGVYGAGVHQSTDGGGTWAPASVGLTQPNVHVLVADPAVPGGLYAGTAFPGGVFRSPDAARTWIPFNTGLEEPDVAALALDPSGPTTLYAGAVMGHVWELTRAPPKGDLDGDFQTDLVFRHELDGRRHQVWLMNGTALVTEAAIAPDTDSSDWRLSGVDDFDADGRQDLVFWKPSTGQVEFWLMNGTSRAGPPVPLSGGELLPPEWVLSATADFLDDGRPDLVWRNVATQKIAIWSMDGTTTTGTIVPEPDQAVNGNWGIVAARDFDANGSPDFLWYNVDSGRIVFWFMGLNPVARLSGQFANPPGAAHANWKVVAGGDYGAGPGGVAAAADIVWRNQTSGKLVVWHMDHAGTRTAGTFTVPDAPTPPLDWSVVGPR